MRRNDFSQLPVFDGDKPVGGVSERTLLDQILYSDDGVPANRKQVNEIMDESWPMVSEDAPLTLLSNLLKYYPAILVQRQGQVVGIITKADLLGVFSG
jgi:predicted transcriptional regulator